MGLMVPRKQVRLTVPMTGGITTTWNPADKSSGMFLSNGNLSISPDGFDSAEGVRSIANVAWPASAIKRHHKITINNLVGNGAIGWGGAGWNFAISPGNSNNTVGWRHNGDVAKATNVIGTAESWTTGDVLHFAIYIDTDTTSLVWCKKNNGNWNNNPTDDPATLTGGFNPFGVDFEGAVYVAGFVQSDADLFTADFSGSGAPAGYSRW